MALPEDDEHVEGSERLVDLPTLRSQRRFLEVMSLVSSAYYWFNIQINPDNNLAGQSVHVGSTRYATTALWIGLLWAAWRYGQQVFRAQHGVLGDIRQDYYIELSRLANNVVRRHLYRLPASERRALGGEEGHPEFRGLARVVRFNREDARRFDAKGKEVRAEIPSGPLALRSHSVIDTDFVWYHNDGGLVRDYVFGIGRIRTFWLVFRAAIAAGFKRPAVFDYATPALMFLFAVLSLLLQSIHQCTAPYFLNSSWW